MQEWRVLFVKPRAEKKVAEYCKFYDVPHYLPLRAKTRVVQRRKVTVNLPVFSGYVFAKVTPAQRLLLLQTNLLVRVLVPINPRAMLRDLVMVRRALRVDPTLTPREPLQKGRMVRIISGPFMGIEGRVMRMSGVFKVVLNVDMIGQAVAVTAEREQVALC